MEFSGVYVFQTLNDEPSHRRHSEGPAGSRRSAEVDPAVQRAAPGAPKEQEVAVRGEGVHRRLRRAGPYRRVNVVRS